MAEQTGVNFLRTSENDIKHPLVHLKGLKNYRRPFAIIILIVVSSRYKILIYYWLIYRTINIS